MNGFRLICAAIAFFAIAIILLKFWQKAAKWIGYIFGFAFVILVVFAILRGLVFIIFKV